MSKEEKAKEILEEVEKIFGITICQMIKFQFPIEDEKPKIENKMNGGDHNEELF